MKFTKVLSIALCAQLGLLWANPPQEDTKILREAIEQMQGSTSAVIQYTTKRQGLKGHQVITEYQTRDFPGCLRTEIQTYLEGDSTPRRTSVRITNENGTFVVYPDAAVAIRQPAAIAKKESGFYASPPNKTSQWLFRGMGYDAVIQPSVSGPRVDFNPAIHEIIQRITPERTPNSKNASRVARIRFMVSPRPHMLLGHEEYDHNDNKIGGGLYERMTINEKLSRNLFDPPSTYEIYFPANAVEFTQYLSNTELKLRLKTVSNKKNNDHKKKR